MTSAGRARSRQAAAADAIGALMVTRAQGRGGVAGRLALEGVRLIEVDSAPTRRIADGIGGANAGDVASRLASDVICGCCLHPPPSRDDPSQARLLAESAVKDANAAILAHARDNPGCASLRTTVVVGYLGNRWPTYAHVGDSRLYRLRDERLQQLTSDHSMIQELVDQGFFQDLEQARQNGINEHILTHALGSGTDLLAPPTAVSELAAGDIFLFCTDGVT